MLLRSREGRRQGAAQPTERQTMSKYARIEGLTDLVVTLRDEGTPWDAKDGIVDQVRAAYPTYTTKSAIPLRKLYHEAKANPVKASKAKIVKARKAGWGWARIAVSFDISESEAKAKVKDTPYGEGRVYLNAKGEANIVDLSGKE